MFSSSGYSHMPCVRMTLCTVTIEVCTDNLDVIPLNARTFQFSRVLASRHFLGPADAICMCDFVCVHISFSATHPYAFAFVAFRLRSCFDIMIGEPKAKKEKQSGVICFL